MKKIILEIFVLLIISAAFAVAYNLFNKGTLNFTASKHQLVEVSDDILFGTQTNTEPVQSPEENNLIEDDTNVQENNTGKDVEDKPISSTKSEITHNSREQAKEIPSADTKYSTVNYEQLLRIIENPNFIIIDARSPELYSKNRIDNAINIFPYLDSEDMVVEKLFQLPQGKSYLIYCDGGNCDSSHKIADMMKSFGFDKVYIYPGGWEEWVKKQQI